MKLITFPGRVVTFMQKDGYFLGLNQTVNIFYDKVYKAYKAESFNKGRK